MDPNRNNVRRPTCLLKFKNCITCQDASTDSDSDEEGDIQDISRHSEVDGVIQETSADSDSDDETSEMQNVSQKDDELEVTTEMNPNRMDIRTYLLKFKNCLTCQNASTDSVEEEEEEEEQEQEQEQDVSRDCDPDFPWRDEQTSLHRAADSGSVEDVRRLLKPAADINVPDIKNNPPLHYAARSGHIDIVDLLLRKNANVNSRNARDRTPLHQASRHGNFAIAQILLKNNADVHVGDRSNNTPIDIARKCGHCELVQLLISSIEYPSLHSAAKYGNAMDVQQILLHCDANPDAINLYGDTPLHLASENDHLEVVEVLLKSNADANIRNASCKTPLYIAAERGYAEIIKALVDHEGRVIVIDGNGNTALHITASNGHSAALKVLLNLSAERDAQICSQLVEIPENLAFSGANVNLCNKDKMTALHLASQDGHTSIVEILLDNQAIVDVDEQSPKTPFYLAAKNGHADVTDLLLHRGVCDFVFTLGHDETPLRVAIKGGHTKVVEVILKHSSRIYEKLTEGGKKLHEIIKKGAMPVKIPEFDGRRVSAEIVWAEKHIPMGIRRKRNGGISPLEFAATMNDPKMFALMLNVEECLYSESDIADSFLYIIKHINDIDDRINLIKAIQYLINSSKFNVNHEGWQLNSLLHEAMRYICKLSADGCPDVIQLLLEKGADFNMKNSFGQTALMIASEYGYCEDIQTLFDWEEKSGLKLDIDARDRRGATALIKATERRHIPVMRLLLKHKASVNMYDYYGRTALHAVFYDPNREWFDIHILGERLCRRKFNNEKYSQIDQKDSFTWEEEHVGRNTAIDQLWEILEHDEKITRIEEKMVELLLDNVETDVNARDFRGNTPLDLAMESSKPITSATFEALKNRGAIRNLLDPKEEASEEQTLVDEGGRNILHLLISGDLFKGYRPKKGATLLQKFAQIFELMDFGSQDEATFTKLAAATDNKERTPLHYAVMSLGKHTLRITESYEFLGQVKALLKLGSDLNAADMFGKNPLHYAESDDCYELLVQHGANENTKDEKGHTPKELKRLRESVTNNEDNAENLRIGNTAFHILAHIANEGLFDKSHVTEFSRQKFVEKIRISIQSPHQQESSEETVRTIWTENDFIRLNRRLSRLKPSVKHFIERVADGVKKMDWRFECQPTLVGSAEEESKVVLSADFDFNFKLIKFSQLCDPFPHPLGSRGFFQLRRKSTVDAKCCYTDKEFDCFFDSDQCLLTEEVNSRFQIILEEVLRGHNFWQCEQLFQCNLHDMGYKTFDHSGRLCSTVGLRMLHPIKDGEGGLLFVKIPIDIVACVHLKDWWPEDPLPVGLNPSVKTSGCTFVFDRSRLNPSKTFARISFAPVESRIIKESSPLIKAAYMICKMILYSQKGTTYQLKTCLLFCMGVLNVNRETGMKVEITPKELAFWVERIMFCFMEFSRYRVYPVYIMPAFILQAKGTEDMDVWAKVKGEENSKERSISYSSVYDNYLDLCPDDASIEIPVVHHKTEWHEHYPSREQFDLKELIRKLSSRSIH